MVNLVGINDGPVGIRGIQLQQAVIHRAVQELDHSGRGGCEPIPRRFHGIDSTHIHIIDDTAGFRGRTGIIEDGTGAFVSVQVTFENDIHPIGLEDRH